MFYEYDQTTFDGNQITIIAENQSFSIHYGLEQNSEKRIAVLRLNGGVFVECPKFENDSGIITPSRISELIKWILTKPSNNTIRKVIYSYPKKVLNESESNILHNTILEEIAKKA